MKIGTKYYYLLKVCKAIDEAKLDGMLSDRVHLHWNPHNAPEKPPIKQKEPPTLPLPFKEGDTLRCEPSGDK